MLGGEIAVLVADIFKLAGRRVDNLNVGRDIAVAVHLGELVEMLVSNLGDIELVVANGEQIVVDVLPNRIRDQPVRVRGIRETSAVVQVLPSYVISRDTT